jgi:murein L,D-transpeptidase YafK
MNQLTLLLILIPAVSIVVGSLAEEPSESSQLPGPQRLQAARKASEAHLREKFRQKGLDYPPREIFLRGIKNEKALELWAREDSGAFVLIFTYRMLAASGNPGPKRQEGDLQVPEGIYKIDRYNPESRFHLSLGINYPNAEDLRFADPRAPGSDIFIHGNCGSFGCMAMGDQAIEEIFLATHDTHQRGQRDIPIHIFPARMSGPQWESFLRIGLSEPRPDFTPLGEAPRSTESLAQFWNRLQKAYLLFECDHRSLEKLPVEKP